jgi:hypothetical protein
MSITMPRHTSTEAVERAFDATGCGWILEMSARESILKQVALELDEFIEEYTRRFNQAPDPFGLIDENPQKAAAFFETFTNPPISLEMRLAVWRLIIGADIEAVRFDYRKGQGLEFVIQLAFRRSDPELYRGESLWDFEVLRHIGILSVDGKPILDGYYASNPIPQ